VHWRRGSGDRTPCILISAIYSGEWSASCPGALTLGELDPLSFNIQWPACAPKSDNVGWRGKSLRPVKIEGWIFGRLNRNFVTVAELYWLRTIKILPTILFGYKNWSLVLSENHRSSVFCGEGNTWGWDTESNRTLSRPKIWQCPESDDEIEVREQTDITSP
jgi:hypothetical protein